MPKQKTKKVGYDRVAVEHDDGSWWWETDQQRWRWLPATGINLCLWWDHKWSPVVCARTIQEAGHFAEGWSGGWEARSRLEADSQPE